MKELKFNSQICTTKEQSQRLIELGLKPETADMCWFNDMQTPCCAPYKCFVDRAKELKWVIFPAWSLHRLIEMCYKSHFGMTIGINNDEVIIDGDLFNTFNNNYHNTYDNLISIIEWVIKLGLFKKEYLK
jgi:hypothetical protein